MDRSSPYWTNRPVPRVFLQFDILGWTPRCGGQHHHRKENSMSTAYKPLFNIRFENIFDARLDKYEVREQIRTDTSDSTRYLAGPDGVLAVFSEQNGASRSFVRPSFEPMPWSTFDALNREFDTEFVSEHDHRFWGFDTAGEWDQFQNEITRGKTMISISISFDTPAANRTG